MPNSPKHLDLKHIVMNNNLDTSYLLIDIASKPYKQNVTSNRRKTDGPKQGSDVHVKV